MSKPRLKEGAPPPLPGEKCQEFGNRWQTSSSIIMVTVKQNVYFLWTMSNYICVCVCISCSLFAKACMDHLLGGIAECGIPHSKDAGDNLSNSGEVPQIVQTVHGTI